MLVLLSPAKTMTGKSKIEVPAVTEPLFADEATRIAREMVGYSVDELAAMLGVSCSLALQTWERYNAFLSPETPAVPSLLAYTGIVFRYLSPADFSAADFSYAQDHLRIASACYGLTRALDGIKPYRMEYTVELPSTGCPLDAYWRPRITDRLIADVQAAGGILVNLASREIQQSLDWARLNREVRVVTPEFKVSKGDTLKTIVVYAKMMRGAMTRFILKNRLTTPQELEAFSAEGFHFSPRHSMPDNPLFIV